MGVSGAEIQRNGKCVGNKISQRLHLNFPTQSVVFSCTKVPTLSVFHVRSDLLFSWICRRDSVTYSISSIFSLFSFFVSSFLNDSLKNHQLWIKCRQQYCPTGFLFKSRTTGCEGTAETDEPPKPIHATTTARLDVQPISSNTKSLKYLNAIKKTEPNRNDCQSQ